MLGFQITVLLKAAPKRISIICAIWIRRYDLKSYSYKRYFETIRPNWKLNSFTMQFLNVSASMC